MRDDEHRALKGAQIILEPFNGLQVQMVGRLVEQQNVNARQHDARQIDARFFAARQAHERPCLHVGRNAQAADHALIGDLEVVAAAVLKGRLHGGVGAHIDLFAGRHVFFHGTQAGAQLLDVFKRLPQHLAHRQLGRHVGQLLQKADAAAAGNGHLPAVIGQQPGKHLEKRRLAAAVGADDAGPLAGLQLKGQIPQDLPLAKV